MLQAQHVSPLVSMYEKNIRHNPFQDIQVTQQQSIVAIGLEPDRDLATAQGIILLDGVMCQGTADFGSCDRSCFFFWREEWLEKIDGLIS